MKSFCDDIALNCDTCYETTATSCDGLLVSGDLVPNTDYFVFVLDKYRNEYSAEFTTNNDGSFTLDPENFAAYLFNSYGGKYEVWVSVSSSGSPRLDLDLEGTDYSCILVDWTVDCVGGSNEGGGVTPSPDCDNEFNFSETCESQYIPIL